MARACFGLPPFVCFAQVIKSILKQVLVGVKGLHSMGIVHRDIKPGEGWQSGRGGATALAFNELWRAAAVAWQLDQRRPSRRGSGANPRRRSGKAVQAEQWRCGRNRALEP
jgi:hypothetical protein